MKWYRSSEYAPEHGSEIFIWDREDQKQVYIHFLAEWNFENTKFIFDFPCWTYVHKGFKPIAKDNDGKCPYACGCDDRPKEENKKLERHKNG